MSRAINIRETQEHIVAACDSRSIRITSIETLVSGGTRVVLSNSADSARLATLYGKKVIDGAVRRLPLRLQRG
ncbi:MULTISPECIES: hypothetical protein [unclassified Sphingomonas]|uniref:hypothetical protein n=1 Tax=unclassified Sphingomonas TaxID=196159 RepID=UPI00070216F7|nr:MULTISPECIES: hypothetical protein [unclassified Sphingomonas]KQX25070.1 hypothetical protein ASD17_23620 [Sphingomonas sp. Root1294]KQY66087.1 hypothetical protein ASD39_13420 [Sphingomonas sp. Root50]KRB89750.1 hypothetical protein ASE22_19175 [Sphingomonas sp. Root720]